MKRIFLQDAPKQTPRFQAQYHSNHSHNIHRICENFAICSGCAWGSRPFYLPVQLHICEVRENGVFVMYCYSAFCPMYAKYAFSLPTEIIDVLRTKRCFLVFL